MIELIRKTQITWCVDILDTAKGCGAGNYAGL